MSEAAAARNRPGPARRPVPAGFPEMARTTADNRLREMYGAGQATVVRWRAETGISYRRPGISPHCQMPHDFAEVARGMSNPEAARYFRRSPETTRRWFVYAGVTPRETRFLSTKPVIRAELDPSMPAQAAQHLRRFYASVHRADIRLDDRTRQTWGAARGLPDGGRGQHFVSGLGVMSDLELIALARDHGFQGGAA